MDAEMYEVPVQLIFDDGKGGVQKRLDGSELDGSEHFEKNCQNVPGAAGAAVGAAAGAAVASAAAFVFTTIFMVVATGAAAEATADPAADQATAASVSE